MSDNQKLRRSWRTNWLSSIQEFADDEAQRRLWLDPTNSNPHFSFVEYFCCYFDNLGLRLAYVQHSRQGQGRQDRTLNVPWSFSDGQNWPSTKRVVLVSLADSGRSAFGSEHAPRTLVITRAA